jgi:hypothetical protein
MARRFCVRVRLRADDTTLQGYVESYSERPASVASMLEQVLLEPVVLLYEAADTRVPTIVLRSTDVLFLVLLAEVQL